MSALLHLETRDTGLQAVRRIVEALDCRVGLPQRIDCLLRCFVELNHRLLDLLGGQRLRLHAFLHALATRRELLHLLDALHQLSADRFHFLHAAPHFFGEFLDAHHAGSHGRLHFFHHLLDVPGGNRGLIGETADLGGDHREALTVFAGFLRFDRGVERQEIGLVRHLGDGGDHGVDVACLLVQHFEFGSDGHRGFDHVMHGRLHLVEAGLAVGGGRGGSLGNTRHFFYGPHQLFRGSGDFGGGGDDLVDRGGLFGGGGLLLLGGGGDLGGGRRHLYAGLLHLIHQAAEIVDHALHALGKLADGVAAADAQIAGEIAFGRAGHHAEYGVDLALQVFHGLA